MSCFETNALIHLIWAFGPISHNISTTENTVKNFQTKSLKYLQANLVKITHAVPNFKIKNLCIAQVVHCSQRVYNLTLCWKIIFLLAFLPLSFPKHADYLDWKKNAHGFLHFHFSRSHPKILTCVPFFQKLPIIF